jgi:hypothetical protein
MGASARPPPRCPPRPAAAARPASCPSLAAPVDRGVCIAISAAHASIMTPADLIELIVIAVSSPMPRTRQTGGDQVVS